MKTKRIMSCFLFAGLMLGLTSCDVINQILDSDIYVEDQNKTNDIVETLSATQYTAPTFDGYSEIPNADGTNVYKFYYFNVGSVQAVPLVTAESYKYSGTTMDVSYTLNESSETNIEKSIETAVSKSTESIVSSSMLISKGTTNTYTQTTTYTVGNYYNYSTVGSEDIIHETVTSSNTFFQNASVKAEKVVSSPVNGATRINTETWGESFDSLNSVYYANNNDSATAKQEDYPFSNAYASYSDSGYNREKTVSYKLEGNINTGFYRYALFSQCEAYLVLAVDAENNRAYSQYTLYPVEGTYYYGIQFSTDGTYTDGEASQKIDVELDDVVTYLNYTPAHLDSGSGDSSVYTVTFNSNGGSTVSSQTVTSGGYATTPSTPTRSGYTFDGWYTNSALTTQYNFSNRVTSNITLYAKWISNSSTVTTYTVTFNSNGGSTVSSQTVTSGGYATTPSTPTRTGYTFAGWYKDSSLTTQFDFSESITQNTTLYAKWTANSTVVTMCTVSFNTKGGSTISSQSVVSGSKVTRPTDPTRTGYVFTGWYTNYACTNAYNFDTTVTSNLTLYAGWVAATSTGINVDLYGYEANSNWNYLRTVVTLTNNTGVTVTRITSLAVDIYINGSIAASATFSNLNVNLVAGETCNWTLNFASGAYIESTWLNLKSPYTYRVVATYNYV